MRRAGEYRGLAGERLVISNDPLRWLIRTIVPMNFAIRFMAAPHTLGARSDFIKSNGTQYLTDVSFLNASNATEPSRPLRALLAEARP